MINENQNQYDKEHREEKRQYDKEHREEKNMKQAHGDQEKREKKKENWTAEDRINAFHESTMWGWSFVCSSCHRKFFEHQVLDLKLCPSVTSWT